MTDNWQKEVYGQNYEYDIERWWLEYKWPKIRRQVIRRDHQRCRRCGEKLPYGECTVHHIIPRSEDGESKLGNLLLLCTPCHDWVELQEPPLRTRHEIESSLIDEHEMEVFLEGEYENPDWHFWVYGGARPPGTRR